MRKSNVTDEEVGRVAWDAYSLAVGGKAFNGDPLPAWDVMCKDEKKIQLVVAWKKAGRAVAALVEKKMPDLPVAKPSPLAIVGAPSGRVSAALAPNLSSAGFAATPPTSRTLNKRTLCCGSRSLSLQSGGFYVCPCGDHKEPV